MKVGTIFAPNAALPNDTAISSSCINSWPRAGVTVWSGTVQTCPAIRTANNNLIVNAISMNLTIEGSSCPSMDKQCASFDRHNSKCLHKTGTINFPCLITSTACVTIATHNYQKTGVFREAKTETVIIVVYWWRNREIMHSLILFQRLTIVLEIKTTVFLADNAKRIRWRFKPANAF